MEQKDVSRRAYSASVGSIALSVNALSAYYDTSWIEQPFT